jgi:outer membrane lipoprotein-sorting protein
MTVSKIRLSVMAALFIGTTSAARADNTSSNLRAMQKAWSQVTSYTATIVSDEIPEGQSTTPFDRTYDFKFLKPHTAQFVITDGAGRGAAATWDGGYQVRFHQGGLLSALKMTVSTSDKRVASVRGDSIDSLSFGTQIDVFATTEGALTDGKDASGQPTVTLTPQSYEFGGVTRDTLTLDRATHLPIKRERYVGNKLVKTENFTNVKLNAGLTAADFAM